MFAGLSSLREEREKRRQEKSSRKAIASDRAGPERKGGLPVNTEPIAPTTGPINVDQSSSPETGHTQATPPQASKEIEPTFRMGGSSLFESHHMKDDFVRSAHNTHDYASTFYYVPLSETQDAKLFLEIIMWISDINYPAIQAYNFERRVAGTGVWAFDDPVIGQWLKGALHILWGIGVPGAGKTILSSIIINHLTQKAKASKRICVAYAFSRCTDLFTCRQVLGGLLRQVVQDHPLTLSYVRPMYERHLRRGTRPSQREVLEVLRDIFESDLFDEKFCTLDGLDEALTDTQVDILDALSELPVNVLVMSRPLPLFKELVPEATFIAIKVHKADIEQLIDETLRKNKLLRHLLENEGWKERVLQTVVKKSSGMFLVASLQLDILGGSISIKSLSSALETLPVGIESMYEATMERIDGGPTPHLALQALTWLVYAREPLTMDDLRHALAVNTETFTYDSDHLIDPETLFSACCGLITFEPETKLVRLVHYTAGDFLKSYISKVDPDVQARLACTCVARLRGCGFENYEGNIDSYSADVFTRHPFLKIAHQNWATYAQLSVSLPPFFGDFVLNCQRFPWQYDDSYPFDFLDSIQLAAACNFHSLLGRWLGLDPSPINHSLPLTLDVTSKSAHGRTALALAAANGHVETVQLLIQVTGIDIRCPDNRGWSPLIWASAQGHVQVVNLLLELVDAAHVNAGRPTALMQAARNGHTEVMKSLLCIQGIDVNVREPGKADRVGRSALDLAAYYDRGDAVRLLLGVEGIDTSASHWDDGTGITHESIDAEAEREDSGRIALGKNSGITESAKIDATIEEFIPQNSDVPEVPPSPLMHEIDLFPVEYLMGITSDPFDTNDGIPDVPPSPLQHDIDLFPVEKWTGDVPSMEEVAGSFSGEEELSPEKDSTQR
ncbi:hypothetical protein FA15DRAFT_672753 [Coprinopsis marcescibilis]|uniref:Uncharacterized protein n=1 Tax=Coprinopsis marcescibilis TaxID=230819 RepID=A0A5C3KM29_COPMA|nr:hypothetical protein FA15DRAFT_672753 [Coprinopsis marcescibilis]